MTARSKLHGQMGKPCLDPPFVGVQPGPGFAGPRNSLAIPSALWAAPGGAANIICLHEQHSTNLSDRVAMVAIPRIIIRARPPSVPAEHEGPEHRMGRRLDDFKSFW